MRNIKLTLAYDGTNYCGFQRQTNGITVQEVLEKNLSRWAKEKISTISAGRTDAGVHARGQVVNFVSNWQIPAAKLVPAVNSKLPGDILVLDAEDAAEDFHARYSAVSKAYCYQICNKKWLDPFQRLYFGHIDRPLNRESMRQAMNYLLGTHDYEYFKSSGAVTKTSVRTISEVNLTAEDDVIKLYFRADGFLYKQVRRMVGSLIDVGIGRFPPEIIQEMLNDPQMTLAGKTAPPQGLYLEQVWY